MGGYDRFLLLLHVGRAEVDVDEDAGLAREGQIFIRSFNKGVSPIFLHCRYVFVEGRNIRSVLIAGTRRGMVRACMG